MIRRATDFAPEGYPLIAVRGVNRLFDTMHADTGRGSVPPERLLCEQPGFNLPYRWFVGPRMEDTFAG